MISAAVGVARWLQAADAAERDDPDRRWAPNATDQVAGWRQAADATDAADPDRRCRRCRPGLTLYFEVLACLPCKVDFSVHPLSTLSQRLDCHKLYTRPHGGKCKTLQSHLTVSPGLGSCSHTLAREHAFPVLGLTPPGHKTKLCKIRQCAIMFDLHCCLEMF